MIEDDVWKTFPSKNDHIPGWTKRICELQAEAFKIEYNFNNVVIVSPANVYGPFDNFDENMTNSWPVSVEEFVKSWQEGATYGDK